MNGTVAGERYTPHTRRQEETSASLQNEFAVIEMNLIFCARGFQLAVHIIEKLKKMSFY